MSAHFVQRVEASEETAVAERDIQQLVCSLFNRFVGAVFVCNSVTSDFVPSSGMVYCEPLDRPTRAHIVAVVLDAIAKTRLRASNDDVKSGAVYISFKTDSLYMRVVPN